MFQDLSSRMSTIVDKISNKGRISESDINLFTREIRRSLLEADVSLPAIMHLLDKVKEKALGQKVVKSLTPGQELISILRYELESLMGSSNSSLNLSATPPVKMLVAGLQGAGKTTSVAKMAKLLISQKKKVLLVSVDVYRPAAIKQLETLSNDVGADFFPSSSDQSPIVIAKAAMEYAEKKYIDVVLFDTAGRLHVDEEMMQEVSDLHKLINPLETLFVVDSMSGQDAVNTAKAFDSHLDLTGIIVTKVDGDSRGGVALSTKFVTGKPIKFLGSGEKTSALEPFHPDRVASRILGMGDMLSLIDTVKHEVDQQKVNKLASKIKKGKGFTLVDFKDQVLQMNKMGGISSVVSKLPMMKGLSLDSVMQQQGSLDSLVAIIDSMTPQERETPEIIKASRKKRIAAGSGTSVQSVNVLLKKFLQMKKMFKNVGKGKSMLNMMSAFNPTRFR